MNPFQKKFSLCRDARCFGGNFIAGTDTIKKEALLATFLGIGTLGYIFSQGKPYPLFDGLMWGGIATGALAFLGPKIM